jgi:hypothetical protein
MIRTMADSIRDEIHRALDSQRPSSL